MEIGKEEWKEVWTAIGQGETSLYLFGPFKTHAEAEENMVARTDPKAPSFAKEFPGESHIATLVFKFWPSSTKEVGDCIYRWLRSRGCDHKNGVRLVREWADKLDTLLKGDNDAESDADSTQEAAQPSGVPSEGERGSGDADSETSGGCANAGGPIP
jgi:hypothetical protein